MKTIQFSNNEIEILLKLLKERLRLIDQTTLLLKPEIKSLKSDYNFYVKPIEQLLITLSTDKTEYENNEKEVIKSVLNGTMHEIRSQINFVHSNDNESLTSYLLTDKEKELFELYTCCKEMQKKILHINRKKN